MIYLYNRKKRIAIILSGIALGFFINYIFPLGAKDYDHQFLLTFGYIGFRDYPLLIITFTKWIMPQILIVYFMGNYFEESILTNLNMILSRTNKVKKLLMYSSINIFIITVIYCISLFVGSAIYSLIILGDFSISVEIIQQMFVMMLYLYLVLLLINNISIIIKPAHAVFVVFLIEVVIFILIKLSFDGFLNIASLHWFIPLRVLFYYNEKFCINNEPTGFLIILAIVIIFYLGSRIVEKRDVL